MRGFRQEIKDIRVIDGDSLEATVDFGYGMYWTNCRIRLYGVDTPEMRARSVEERLAAREAKDYLESILRYATSVYFVPRSAHKDSFGRLLGNVLIHDRDASEMIIEQGFGVPYKR